MCDQKLAFQKVIARQASQLQDTRFVCFVSWAVAMCAFISLWFISYELLLGALESGTRGVVWWLMASSKIAIVLLVSLMIYLIHSEWRFRR